MSEYLFAVGIRVIRIALVGYLTNCNLLTETKMFGTSVVTVVDKDTQRKEKHRAIVKLSYEKNDGAAKKRAQRFERERRKELEKLEAEILPMRGVLIPTLVEDFIGRYAVIRGEKAHQLGFRNHFGDIDTVELHTRFNVYDFVSIIDNLIKTQTSKQLSYACNAVRTTKQRKQSYHMFIKSDEESGDVLSRRISTSFLGNAVKDRAQEVNPIFMQALEVPNPNDDNRPYHVAFTDIRNNAHNRIMENRTSYFGGDSGMEREFSGTHIIIDNIDSMVNPTECHIDSMRPALFVMSLTESQESTQVYRGPLLCMKDVPRGTDLEQEQMLEMLADVSPEELFELNSLATLAMTPRDVVEQNMSECWHYKGGDMFEFQGPLIHRAPGKAKGKKRAVMVEYFGLIADGPSVTGIQWSAPIAALKFNNAEMIIDRFVENKEFLADIMKSMENDYGVKQLIQNYVRKPRPKPESKLKVIKELRDIYTECVWK